MPPRWRVASALLPRASAPLPPRRLLLLPRAMSSSRDRAGFSDPTSASSSPPGSRELCHPLVVTHCRAMTESSCPACVARGR